MHFLKSKWRSLLSPMIKRGVESSIPCLAFLIRGAVSLLYATCRLETMGFERLKNKAQEGVAFSFFGTGDCSK